VLHIFLSPDKVLEYLIVIWTVIFTGLSWQRLQAWLTFSASWALAQKRFELLALESVVEA
jgi:hypothetical protein